MIAAGKGGLCADPGDDELEGVSRAVVDEGASDSWDGSHGQCDVAYTRCPGRAKEGGGHVGRRCWPGRGDGGRRWRRRRWCCFGDGRPWQGPNTVGWELLSPSLFKSVPRIGVHLAGSCDITSLIQSQIWIAMARAAREVGSGRKYTLMRQTECVGDCTQTVPTRPRSQLVGSKMR